MDPNSLHQLAEGAGRVGLALLLGAALGTNRALIGKSAGPRTFAMVTLGAALVTWLGASMMVVEHDLSAPSRIIQGLLTGTGFLGGGLILRAHVRRVRGLTTAATLWFAAALGAACGMGRELVAVAATLMALGVLAAIPLERRLDLLLQRRLHHRRRLRRPGPPKSPSPPSAGPPGLH